MLRLGLQKSVGRWNIFFVKSIFCNFWKKSNTTIISDYLLLCNFFNMVSNSGYFSVGGLNGNILFFENAQKQPDFGRRPKIQSVGLPQSKLFGLIRLE